MGLDGIGMNCYEMVWDIKIYPMDKPEAMYLTSIYLGQISNKI